METPLKTQVIYKTNVEWMNVLNLLYFLENACILWNFFQIHLILFIYLTIYLFMAVKDMKLTFQVKNFTLPVAAIDGTFTSLCLFAFSKEQKDFSIDNC